MKRIIYEYGSEEHAIKLEEAMNKKYESIAEVVADSSDIFAAAFTNPADRTAIFKLLDSYSHLAECDSDFTERLQLMMIWNKEISEGEVSTILDFADSPEETISIFRELKYLLFRADFNKADDNGESICNLIKEYRISATALTTMVEWCCVKGVLVLIGLAKIFLEKGMTEYSTNILRRVKND